MMTYEFEIEHSNRMFDGLCNVSLDNDGDIANVDIEMLCWYSVTDGKGYYHEVERGDRNWLRINELLVRIELDIKKRHLK